MRQNDRQTRKKLAIIGSGVAALVAGWMWRDEYEITIIDKSPKLGGHIDTVYLDLHDWNAGVDAQPSSSSAQLVKLDLGFYGI